MAPSADLASLYMFFSQAIPLDQISLPSDSETQRHRLKSQKTKEKKQQREGEAPPTASV
jgi:hypothetical protein